MNRRNKEFNKAFVQVMNEQLKSRKIRKRKYIINCLVIIASVSIVNTYVFTVQPKVHAAKQVYVMKKLPTNNLKTVGTEALSEKSKVEPIETIEIVEMAKSVNKIAEAVKQIEPTGTEITESIYNEKIPMPKAHQEYLYKLCKERDLDYKYILSILKNESQFKSDCISNKDYGYFQINEVNHDTLSKTLNTQNNALDPYINMNWATYMLSEIYTKWEAKGYTGYELNNMVLSEYNKGAYGLQKWGIAKGYIQKVQNEKQFIDSVF